MNFLEKLIARKKAEMKELQERSNASQDLAEVRAIGAQLEALKKEIEEAEAELSKADLEGRSEIPENAVLRNAVVVSSTGVTQSDDEGTEYRNAFMNFVLRGTAIPAEFRDNANTTTGDVGAVIPSVLVDRIVERMEKLGTILNAVTRTAYKGGVSIPVSTLKPVATWVGVSGNLTGEGLGSDRQKVTATSVTFSYHKLRCEVSMSMEVSVMTLPAFEARFTENVARAMIKAIEIAIINGDGTNQPKGILRETPADGQAITGAISYAKLVEAESAVPEEYEEGAVWCMTKKDFFKFVGMVDADGQPIARVTYGIGGKPERVLLGRPVLISANAVAGTPFIFDFADYVLNTLYDMGISKKQDWDTEDLLTKAVMSVDGKVVDKGSLVTFAYTPSV